MRGLRVWCFILLFGVSYTEISLLGDTDVNNNWRSRAINKDAEPVPPEKMTSHRLKSAIVKRLWGVHDAESLTGRRFSYKIPNDAFEGEILSYKFPNLPSWLIFNEAERVLEGVPILTEEGHHYVTVVAEGATSNAKDVFDVHVTAPSVVSLLEDSSCHVKDKLTVMSVVIDASLSDLSPKQKLKLSEKSAKIFNIHVNKITLADLYPLSEETTIMAAAGKRKTTKIEKPRMIIEFGVGCNGEISRDRKHLIDIMSASAESSKLQEYLNFPVVGWHVTSRNPFSKVMRKRAILEGSGDESYYENYDYDEENYDEYDQFFENHNALVTSVSKAPSTDSTGSPAKGGSVPTPVIRPTYMTTPTLIPVKPTRVVEPSPTVEQSSVLPVDRTGFDLESSIQTYPTATAESTTALREHSTDHIEMTHPYEPIEPTSLPEFTDHTEYGTKNFAPVIKNRIPKLGWVTGNVYKMIVPADAFEDQEDGGTRNMSLVLKDNENKVFGYNSWIQLNPIKQEIYALPLESHISMFRVRLEAVDSGHKSTMDELNIRLSQPKEARNYNHEFSIVLKLEQNNEYEFIYALDWQIRAVEKIAEVFGGKISEINVRNISVSPLIHITWTNVTVVDSLATVCPEEELQKLAKIITKGTNEPTEKAKLLFKPEFELKHAHIHYRKSCSFLNHRQTGGESPPKHDNQPPVFRNQIDQLVANEGKVFRYKVKEDSCYDLEDGSISSMTMRLLTSELSPPSRGYWLQFDEANREFYGLPLSKDVAKRDYILECIDRGGKKVSDALVIVVQPSKHVLAPVQFSLTVDGNYEEFMMDVKRRVNLVDKIAGALGDQNSDSVMVGGVRSGSVVITWYNTSLEASFCPRDHIQRLRELMTDDAGKVKESFKSFFAPAFVVKDVHVQPEGECLSGDTPTHSSDVDLSIDATIPEEQEVGPSDEDYLLTFIIPAVLIALMLILAALIACCLWRRRRYAKMSLTDDRTFVAKGRIPIIFAEELDDQNKSDRANTPVIMHEEKPPLPPPEYQRHTPAAMASAPLRGEMASSDHGPYQPPQPPYASANGSSINPRRNMPPAYRKTPTYLPP